jgi:23S rRNA G2069 N7-methylase RlmK/C1962 C5-methylase RlmI
MEKDNTEAKIDAQAEMLANRLKKRLRHLSKWAARTGTDAFRLYDRDIPEIPLVLDKYGDFVSGALYKRPYEKDQADESKWLAAMGGAAAQALGLKRENIIIKLRERQSQTYDSQSDERDQCGHPQYKKIAERGIIREIREGGLKFKVNLSDYLDTGLFLDRRALRRIIRADSGGKRVLNLFCYTASFSVCAASGSGGAPINGAAINGAAINGAKINGAASTDSVDLSNTYLNWARDNFAINGFSTEIFRLHEYFSEYHDTSNKNPQSLIPDPRSLLHRLIRADVAAFLHKAAVAQLRWDIIILDPPAFSNSTMSRTDFDLQRDYGATLALCLALLAPGGKLWFSAAARSFKASATELAKLHPGVTVTDIGSKIIDEDFKGKKMPKAFEIAKSNEQS